ncbi:RNAPII degradation factor, partial [Spiromyces aspiralis]
MSEISQPISHPSRGRNPNNSRGSSKPFRSNNNNKHSSLDSEPTMKSLKAKYRQQLATVKEIFPGWKEGDLLSALEEAAGDLDLAIARITEGHAAQWGEVKTRKEKRQASKGTSDENTQTTTRTSLPSSTRTGHLPRPASIRGGVRGGAARGGRGHPRNAAVAGGRAALAAKNADTASASQQETKREEAAITSERTNENPAASAKPAQPVMTWANIAKRGTEKQQQQQQKQQQKQIKPETKVAAPEETKLVPEEESPSEEPAYAEAKESPTELSKKVEQVQATKAAQPEVQIKEAESQTLPETQKGAAEIEAPQVEEPTAEPVKSTTDVLVVVEEETKPEQKEEIPTEKTAQTVSTTAAVVQEIIEGESVKRPSSNSRRLLQDAPVVLPYGNSVLDRVAMRFGSLSLHDSGNKPAQSNNAASAAATVSVSEPGPKEPTVLSSAVPIGISSRGTTTQQHPQPQQQLQQTPQAAQSSLS